MNQTNFLAALLAIASMPPYTNSVVNTNWVATGNIERHNGTNQVEEYMSEINTTEFREQVSVVTNRVAIKITRELFSGTNTVLRMRPQPVPPPPGAPGVPTKL